MSAVEMYDYLTTKTPDYSGTLSVTPQDTLIEKVEKSQAIHEYDSGDVDVVSFSNKSIFMVTLQWNLISESNSGIIFDFYNDYEKANGMENTFKWQHIDGHVYVVRFASPLSRGYKVNTFNPSNRRSISQITLRVEGIVS